MSDEPPENGRFAVGHPYHPPRDPLIGARAPRARAGKMLAQAIRDAVEPEEIVEWLVSVWRGRDPVDGSKVELADRRDALRTLLERGYGMPAQHVVIEAQITASQSRDLPEGDAMDDLDDDALLALEKLGIGLGDVIDLVD